MFLNSKFPIKTLRHVYLYLNFTCLIGTAIQISYLAEASNSAELYCPPGCRRSGELPACRCTGNCETEGRCLLAASYTWIRITFVYKKNCIEFSVFFPRGIIYLNFIQFKYWICCNFQSFVGVKFGFKDLICVKKFAFHLPTWRRWNGKAEPSLSDPDPKREEKT